MLVGEMAGAGGVFAKRLSVGREHYEPEMFIANSDLSLRFPVFFLMFELTRRIAIAVKKRCSAPFG